MISSALSVVAQVCLNGEGLGDNGAHREVKNLLRTIRRLQAIGDIDEAILVRIIREQGCVQVVDNAVIGTFIGLPGSANRRYSERFGQSDW